VKFLEVKKNRKRSKSKSPFLGKHFCAVNLHSLVFIETFKSIGRVVPTTNVAKVESKVECLPKSPAVSPKIYLHQNHMETETVVQSTSYKYDFEEGTVEAKPFEELTSEEKATVSILCNVKHSNPLFFS
jgi:hypothetical protein